MVFGRKVGGKNRSKLLNSAHCTCDHSLSTKSSQNGDHAKLPLSPATVRRMASKVFEYTLIGFSVVDRRELHRPQTSADCSVLALPQRPRKSDITNAKLHLGVRI